MTAIDRCATAWGTSPEATAHFTHMQPWLLANTALVEATLSFVETIKPLLAAAPNKMCDRDADWYNLTLLLANLVKPENTWWVVQYLAPFVRMGLCGKVFFMHLPTESILFGKRSATMRDQPDLFDLPAGNWNYGEDAVDTATREASEEINAIIAFILGAPFLAKVRYLDYGGEKGRAHLDACFAHLVTEQFIPAPNAEMSEWHWLTREQVLNTGRLAFEDTVNGDACTEAFNILKNRASANSILNVARTSVLNDNAIALLRRTCGLAA